MSSTPPSKAAKRAPVLVPHPDDLEDVRAGLEEARRGELLSAEDSAAYVRELLEGETPGK